MRRVLLALALSLVGVAAHAQSTVTWTNLHQNIDGFGVACSFHSPCDTLSGAQNTLFFDATNGIGLSIFHYYFDLNQSSCSSTGTGCTFAFPQPVTAAIAAGAKVWIVPMTVPPAMKSNGAVICNTGSGNGVLNPGSYAAYATYLRNVATSFQTTFGVLPYAMSVQNEPNFCPTTYSGTSWTGQNVHDFILNNMGPTFAGSGIKIMEPEFSWWNDFNNGSTAQQLVDITMTDPSAAAFVGIVAGHDYTAQNSGFNAPNIAGYSHLGTASFWETETGNSIAFDNPPSMTGALVWAQNIHKYLTTAQVNAWHYFQIAEQVGLSDQSGLMLSNGTVSKTAYIMGNWSKFVRPGWVRIDMGACAAGVFCSAFKDPVGGGFVIVAVNTNGSTTPQTINLTGFPTITGTQVANWRTSGTENLLNVGTVSTSGNQILASLPASSVTTFVGATTNAGAQLWAGVLAPPRALDWTQKGFPGTNLPSAAWPVCTTIAPYTGTSATIQNALAACHTANPTGGVVALGAGTFNISNGILYPAGNFMALRGAGASQTFVHFTTFTDAGGGYVGIKSTTDQHTFPQQGGNGAPGNVSVNVTAGLTKGSTQVTVSAISSIVVGSVLIINQCDNGYTAAGLGAACVGSSADNGNYYHCAVAWSATNTGCAQPTQGGNNSFRSNANEIEGVVVTAINAGGCGATCLTISKPIEQPDWGAATQAVVMQPRLNAGIENMSLIQDVQSSYPSCLGPPDTCQRLAGIDLFNTLHSWVSGLQFINFSKLGIQSVDAFGNVYKDNYFFGNPLQFGDNTSIRINGGSDNIIQNNIGHQNGSCAFIADATIEGSEIFGYNYCAGGQPKPNSNADAGWYTHGPANQSLFEGNIGRNIFQDDIHGTNSFYTLFRNFLWGWTSCANNCGGGHAISGNDNSAYINWYGDRYPNIIGNITGTSGFSANYQTSGSFDSRSIYILGAGNTNGGIVQPTDPIVAATAMRWCNYDTVNAAVRCLNSEVPTAAPVYPNPVPATQSLPASFYIAGSKPTWFGTIPWPTIGPDVTGGNVGQCAGTLDVAGKFNGTAATNASQCAGSGLNTAWGGHINANPAFSYYLQLGGLTDGTGPALTAFDAIHYAGGGGGPTDSLTPGSSNFGNLNVGLTSGASTFTFTNTSASSTVTISSTPSVTGDFSISANACTFGLVLAAGANCTINVTFSPSTTGLRSGTLSVSSNAVPSPATASLTGTGTQAAITWTPSTFAYGNVALPGSANHDFVLQNTGTGTLNISLTIGGANPAQFSIVTTTCTSTLAPTFSCSVTVKFTPAAVASYNGTLVETDSVGGINASVTLSGSGITVTPVLAAPAPWIL
jgi:O-glycosyl hydrolase